MRGLFVRMPVPRSVFFRVAVGSANWLLAPLVLAILFVGLAGPLGQPWLAPFSMAPFSVFLFFLLFFRDPDRAIAQGVVSPADGKVVRLDKVDDEDLGPCDRIAVYMGPSNVHVNRAPLEGDVRSVVHIPGGHVPAFSKDSERNERVITRLHTTLGDVKVVQIAGAVARRIVPYVENGDHLERGGRMGLIRLGSRCDVLIPEGRVRWIVAVGDRVFAGSSQVGEVL